jgi:pimeloyl-ACP methyl ester carboxylesterase
LYRRIRDLEVYCEIVGEGKPIVMVHGMGVDHRTMKGCMEPVFQNRRDEWQRIYFDLPGMGRTKGTDWITDSDGMLRFVLAFIDQVIAHEPFLMVGESYGGYLVRAAVRERLEDVDGMLLIGPLVVADDEQRDVPPCSVLMRDSALQESLDLEEKGLLDLFLVNQSAENWERFRDEMLVGFEGGDEAFKARIRGDVESYAFTFDLDESPVPFEKPSLILTGRQDCLVGYRDAWKLMDNYPRSSFVVLDMAGHGLQIEQAVLFNALVNEWLDRVKSEDDSRSDRP